MRWLLAPDPYVWESLGQWVQRIGQIYGHRSSEQFLELYGFNNLSSARLFYDPPSDILELVSEKTNYSTLALSQRTWLFFRNIADRIDVHECKLQFLHQYVVTASDIPSLFDRHGKPEVFARPRVYRETIQLYKQNVLGEITALCRTRPLTSMVFHNLTKLFLLTNEAVEISSVIVENGCELFDVGSALRISNRVELDTICFFEMMNWHDLQTRSVNQRFSKLKGRKSALSPSEAREALRSFKSGESVSDIAGLYGIARSTVYLHLKAQLSAERRNEESLISGDKTGS
jgi:hypothetical protein